jgi:hypothetical protein
MVDSKFSRRTFSTLTAAAFSGLMVGAASAAEKESDKELKLKVDPALLVKEPHVCKGLNTCHGLGKGGDNACAGQGKCAVVEAHGCAKDNACKGQGGCDGYPGQNTCKGLGHCSVPLEKEGWAIARKQFEQLMADIGKKVGDAPN